MRTAWNARWVYLITLFLTLGWAIAGRSIAREMTGFILGPFGGEADAEHALARLTELLLHNSELAAGVGLGVLITAGFAWLAWTALGGVVFFALRGDDTPDALASGARMAGPMLVQGLVHTALTAICVVLLGVILGPLPTALRLLGLFVGLSIAVLARDLVRAQICLHPLDKPYHPRAAVHGFVQAAKRPGQVAITGGLWLLKTALAVAAPVLAFRALGPDSAALWLHLVTVFGLALSFVRLAWVTHWVPVDLEPTAASASAEPTDGDSA